MKLLRALVLATALAGIPMGSAGLAQESPQVYLQRIEAIDDAGPRLNAVTAVAPDALRANGTATEPTDGPLSGLSILIKDNIETRDMPTTAGSLALKDNATGRDAPLVARLRKAGAVILGKTNLSEWANFRGDRSSSGWSGVGGQTRNPYAIDRSPCGSSAGSGAAVAAGLAWAAVGTETDGSITCPASVNGIVGFKPTVGLVSRTWVIPISASQDTAGPMAGRVLDAARLLTAMAGSDPADPATAEADNHATDFTRGLAKASLAGVRVGVLRKQAGNIPSLTALFDRALADMSQAGATIIEIEYYPDETMWRDEYQVLLYEFREGINAYLAALPGTPAVRSLQDLIDFNKAHTESEMRFYGQETFIEAQAAQDAKVYGKARSHSRGLAGPQGIDRLLSENALDVLVAPTSGPTWPIDLVRGDPAGGIGAGSLAAIAGYPHLTVPMGQVEHLPIGLSFIAGKWEDAKVLKIGAAYEKARSAPLPPPSLKPWQE